MTKTKVRLIIAVVCVIGIALVSWSIASTLGKADYNALGLAQYEAGNYEEAIECFAKAIEQDPNNAIAYHNRGLAYCEKGKQTRTDPNEKAIADFSKAIELDPSFVDAYYNRGLMYSGVGHAGIHHYHKLPTESWSPDIEDRYKRALADFNKCLELDPNYVLAHAGKGNLFYKYYDNYEDMKKTIAEYDRALEAAELIVQKVGNKGLAGVYYSRGRTYTNMGRWDKAESDYLKAIELDPNCGIALGHLAHLYIDLGRYSEALALNDRRPETAYHFYEFRGICRYELKQYDKAISDFQSLMDKYPGSAAVANRYLGMIYRQKGDAGKATAYFEKAVDLATKTAVKGGSKTFLAYYERGLNYVELGELDKALRDFLKVVELKAASDREYGHRNYYIDAHIGLGKVYSEMGEKEKAREYFERAIELLQRPGGPEPIMKEVEELLNKL